MDLNPTKEENPDKTTNYEGGEAYTPRSTEMQLYKLTINNLLENKYYEEDTESLNKLSKAFHQAKEENPEFPVQLAAYAREEMYLRSISQALLVHAAKHEETQPYVRQRATTIIQRPDDAANAVALWLTLYGKPLSKTLKKTLSDALNQFDEYQLSKYRMENREVNLYDVFNLVHPTPRDKETEKLWSRLMASHKDSNDLEPLTAPETWEVVISERGNTAEAWLDVLPRMGLFAKTRNIRNMLEAGVDGEQIFSSEDLERVRGSKMYPFRFYQAYKALKRSGERSPFIERWLSSAINEATENVPEELGNTFVAVDLSGSMDSALSSDSELPYNEVASFLGAVLGHHGAVVGAFGDDFERVPFYTDTPVLEVATKIRDTDVGHSTNAWKALRSLIDNGDSYSRVVILTDMQVWDSTSRWDSSGRTVEAEWRAYKETGAGEESSLYMLDMSSYGDLVTPEGHPDVYNVSGWNDRVLEFIQYAEEPGQVLEEVREA